MHDRGEDGKEYHQQIEITGILDVEAVQEAFTRRPVAHHRDDFLRPAEFIQDEKDKNHHQGEQHHPLHGIRDQHGKGAAAADQSNGQDQTNQDHDEKSGNRDPEYLNPVRQIQEIDEESGRNGRHDHICQHFRN